MNLCDKENKNMHFSCAYKSIFTTSIPVFPHVSAMDMICSDWF